MGSREACCASCAEVSAARSIHSSNAVQWLMSCAQALAVDICDNRRTSIERGAGPAMRFRGNGTSATEVQLANLTAGRCDGRLASDPGGKPACIKVIQGPPYSHVVLALAFRDGGGGAVGGPQIFDVASVLPSRAPPPPPPPSSPRALSGPRSAFSVGHHRTAPPAER
jgi:hypothetical protein